MCLYLICAYIYVCSNMYASQMSGVCVSLERKEWHSHKRGFGFNFNQNGKPTDHIIVTKPAPGGLIYDFVIIAILFLRFTLKKQEVQLRKLDSILTIK